VPPAAVAPPVTTSPVPTPSAPQAPALRTEVQARLPATALMPVMPTHAPTSQATTPNFAEIKEKERAAIRKSLVQRLSDVICIPGSQITPLERHMAGDILVEMLRDADISMRESVAKRLVRLNEAPRTILVLLAKDEYQVAQHVLEESKSLTDSDLIQIARKVTTAHRVLIAKRREVSDAVADTLVEFLEEDVVETLLFNKGASFSEIWCDTPHCSR